jgi:hypothetical protein
MADRRPLALIEKERQDLAKKVATKNFEEQGNLETDKTS